MPVEVMFSGNWTCAFLGDGVRNKGKPIVDVGKQKKEVHAQPKRGGWELEGLRLCR